MKPILVTPAEDIKRAMAAHANEIRFSVGRAEFVVVRIPPGEFDMGSPGSEKGHMPNESPVRHVRISKGFYLGRYEVTQLQYKEVTGKDRDWRFPGESLPVQDLWYAQVLDYCETLSRLLGVAITLPTEAQWEYACRAGTTTRFYSGDAEEDLDKVAWYRENARDRSHPVGQKQPNAWGLYDMLGNVAEPCIDSWFGLQRVGGLDPKGTLSTAYGATRGGAWMQPAEECRAASSEPTEEHFGGMGIRLAMNVETEKEKEK